MTQKLQFWTTTLVVFSCQEATIIDPSCLRSHRRGGSRFDCLSQVGRI
jgi:hypothetical protein